MKSTIYVERTATLASARTLSTFKNCKVRAFKLLILNLQGFKILENINILIISEN